MTPKEHHIKVSKTARYYTTGEFNSHTKNILIVLHGHRQLAGDFITKFTQLAKKDFFIIAPEGLSKFYLRGDFGDIGATWMTKADRENEIIDYVNYLDTLYDAVIKEKHRKYDFAITALGFSQGAATLSRWLALGKSKVDKAIFWCGNLAKDINYNQKSNLHRAELYIVYSDNDQYLTIDFMESHVKMLKGKGLNPVTHIFHGTHEINRKLLNETGIL